MINISFTNNNGETVNLWQINLENKNNYISLAQHQGLFDVSSEISTVRVPRTDFFQTNSILLGAKARTFSGFIKGFSGREKIALRQKIANIIGQEVEFRIDFYLPDESLKLYESYRFLGIIKDFLVPDFSTNSSEYSLSIISDDPFIYSFDPIVLTKTLTTSGFVYPMTFPLQFGDESNNLVYTNTGNNDILPIWTITNKTQNLTIRNNINSKVFSSSLDLVDGQTLTIDTKKRTARMGGNNVLDRVNNISALVIKQGQNNFSVNSDSANNTTATATFFKTYKSI